MRKSLLLILLATIVLAGCTSSISETRQWTLFNKDSNIINCKLSLANVITSEANSNWDYNKIETETSRQKAPLELTIVWLDTKNPVMKGNLDTVPLVKIDNGETIYLVETSDAGNIDLYTYFPKEKIIIRSTQYNLIWTLFWEQMMWFCQ